MTNGMHTPRLILVDGSGYIFRAYHALPPLTRRDGVAVGAVFGFTKMLLKLKEQYARDYLLVVFDASRKSFRTSIYPEYKAHRPPPPEDLVPQFALVREATQAMQLPMVEMLEYEADDLIASYAVAAKAQGMEALVVSSDKDLMQLIADGVAMFDPMKNKPIGEAECIEKFGVSPALVPEVQALIGDSTDNVPGVPSIGPKTAAELVLAYGSLEGVLNNIANIKQPKRREVLEMHAEAARLSYQLVQLKRDVPLPLPITECAPRALESSVLLPFLTEQNFTSLMKQYGQGAVVAAMPSATYSAVDTPVTPTEYTTITDMAVLQQWLAEATAQGIFAIDTETTSLAAVDAELVGISLALADGRAAYIPLAHVRESEVAASVGQSSLFDAPTMTTIAQPVEGQLPRDAVLHALAPILCSASILKIGHNLKYDMLVLQKYGITLRTLADTMLMSYVTSAGLHGHGLDELALLHFGHRMISFADVTGKGRDKKTFAQVEISEATRYAAEDADFTWRLYHHLLPQLREKAVTRVYEHIERPLLPVIVAMEGEGISIDIPKLHAMSREFEGLLAQHEKEIHALAGREFSVASPKQLGEILFEVMGLPNGKKSFKSGAYTTDAETLEALHEQGFAIAGKVLEWRHLAKLKSTYTDTLPQAISPRTGRVHTSYSLAATTTGRLSSSDPNLQNIPIRSPEGKRIREAFIPREGYTLLSADYSQIELRLLAHIANIEVLKQAFRDGKDIHAITASQMFGVPLEAVDSTMRRNAKTINFGIIYGISAHGLATRLGISRPEAASYIESYFKQYPGIREYMDATIAFARQHGFVETLAGRKIHVKGIADKNPNIRNFSERAAINAPLQGTAADIIKAAMLRVQALCDAEGAKLLLQVHDELVMEAPHAIAHAFAPKVKQAMERAAQLSLPLTVEVGVGANWGVID